MKKIFIIFMIICSFIVTDVHASTNTFKRTKEDLLVTKDVKGNDSRILNTLAVDASEKVYDFASLFTEDEEKKLYSMISNYIDSTKTDLAIVTINENNKNDAREYAEDFYDYNDFGIGKDYTGILFLIDMDTREIYMVTTGKARDVYSDGDVDDILDITYTYMSDEEYFKGCTTYMNALKSIIEIDASNIKHLKLDSNGEVVKDYSYLVIVFIFALVVTLVAILIMVHMHKMVYKASTSREYLNKDTLDVKKTDVKFMGSHTSRVIISTDSGGSGHSGGSGISHGGGGHHF